MLELNSDNYETETKAGKIVVDFWAEWCGPCKLMSPVLEAASKEQPKIKFAKLNVDEHPEIAAKFNVMSIPTLIMFEDGKQVGQSIGYVPKNVLNQRIKEAYG